MDISKNLKLLESAFAAYDSGSISIDVFEDDLGSWLSDFNPTGAIGKKVYKVKMINSDPEVFFGFQLFPKDWKRLVQDLVHRQPLGDLIKTWEDIDTWVLEVDSKLFDRTFISLNPEEIMSLLLHEICKTIYSSITIERLHDSFRRLELDYQLGHRSDTKILQILYAIPLAKACMVRDWTCNADELNISDYSYSLIEQYQYTDMFKSAIGKITKNFGNSLYANEEQKIDIIDNAMHWCNLMIKDFNKRKYTLKDDIIYRAIMSTSLFYRVISLKILASLGIGLRESYTGNTVDMEKIIKDPSILSEKDFVTTFECLVVDQQKFSVFEKRIINYDPALESLVRWRKANKNSRPQPPNQYDIDAIAVEIDRITNHHDRIYILDLIYKMIDELDDFSALMEKDDYLKNKYEGKVKSMYDQLLRMRKDVLSKKNFDKTYKVFVKVPKGYEG